MKKIALILLAIVFAFNIQAQLDRSTPPQAGPAPKINIGQAKSFELKNGLKVFVVENHKVPVVSYSLSLDIDPVLEGEKVGYVSMAGDLMRAGTTNRSKADLDASIDFIGATLSTYSQGIYARSLKKHSDELLDLMTDVLYNASFPAEELEKNKKQALTGLKSQKDDPAAIASNVASVLKYGKNHPYGEVQTEATIEAITIDDCKNYYETYFRPNVAYLVIVGDITAKEAKKQVKKYFASWEAADVPSHQYDFPKSYESPKVAVANKDAATQSTINLTYAVNLTPGHPDAIKARVMNQVLGGGSFSARLFQNLREDKAFTYGAYSRLSNDELAGSFTASSQVRGSVTDSAFTEIIYEMNRMREELVAKEDLQLVINSMTGSFSRSLEDPQTIARFALNIEKYGLAEDYYETYLEKLAAVTPEDVKAMANKYLTPDNAIILAVGDVSKIKSTLKKFSKDGQVDMYNFYGEEVKSMPLPAGLTAEKVIADYVKAIGGVETLQNVNDVVMNASLTMQGMTINVDTYQRNPNHLCVETKMNGNIMQKQVCNGEAAKMVGPGGEQQLEGPMLEKMKVDAYLFPELKYAELGFKTELLGTEEVEGQDTYKLKITSPDGSEKTAFFSRATGLKVKEVAQMGQVSVITLNTEYTEVDGIKFPKAMKQTMGPQSFDVVVETIKVNQGIEDSIFEI